MKQEAEIVDFFREILDAVSKYGLKVVTTYIEKIHYDLKNSYEFDIFNYILEKTSKHYTIEKSFILKSKKRLDVSEARKMCFALMKEHLPLSDEEIGKYFGGRSRQYVNKELMKSPLNQDTLTTKHETKFVEDFLVLTKDVDIFKKSYNIENKIKLHE